MEPIIVWFRQDLRLADHPALDCAREDGAVFPLFIDDESDPWAPGLASRWWLDKSLACLSDDLKELGGKLCIKKGDPLKILKEVSDKIGAKKIYWNRVYEPYARNRDKKIQKELADLVEVKTFEGNLLFEPDEVLKDDGTPYQVFTPFWKNCLKTGKKITTCPKPQKITFCKESVSSDSLEKPEGDFSSYWEVGEKAAMRKLKAFLKEKGEAYGKARDIPSENGTSLLSPHLHFGEISPRQIWEAAGDGHQKFISEVGWREFSYTLLYHFPNLPEKAFKKEFSKFPYIKNEKYLNSWKEGQTGFPIVDAGMRELKETGYMHNRVRMITASFLTKDLFISWWEGEKWFWERLVDADLANNSASWQWVAGSGADAAPYFRIFNPVLQGEKFDSEGEYVKKWVPELKEIPKKWVHKPWEAPPLELRSQGVVLGQDYPFPMVDHKKQRDQALKIYEEIK